MAYTDHLTALPNRAILFQEMAAPVHRRSAACSSSTSTASRPSTTSPGTRPATSCWSRWPAGCNTVVRDDDLVARLGGDEFAVLVTGSITEAEDVAQRVVDALALPHRTSDWAFAVGASVGVAELGAAGGQVAFREADAALRAAKQAGKGCVRLAHHEVAHIVIPDADLAAVVDEGVLPAAARRRLRPRRPDRAACTPSRCGSTPCTAPSAARSCGAAAERQGRSAALQRWLLRQACAEVAAPGRRPHLRRRQPPRRPRHRRRSGRRGRRRAGRAPACPRRGWSLSFTEETLLTSSAALVPELEAAARDRRAALPGQLRHGPQPLRAAGPGAARHRPGRPGRPRRAATTPTGRCRCSARSCGPDQLRPGRHRRRRQHARAARRRVARRRRRSAARPAACRTTSPSSARRPRVRDADLVPVGLTPTTPDRGSSGFSPISAESSPTRAQNRGNCRLPGPILAAGGEPGAALPGPLDRPGRAGRPHRAHRPAAAPPPSALLRRVVPLPDPAVLGRRRRRADQPPARRPPAPALAAQRWARASTSSCPRGAGAWLRGRGFPHVDELSRRRDASPTATCASPPSAPSTAATAGARGSTHGPATESLGYLLEGGGTTRLRQRGHRPVRRHGGARPSAPIDVALLPVWGWGPTLGPGHLDPVERRRGRRADPPADRRPGALGHAHRRRPGVAAPPLRRPDAPAAGRPAALVRRRGGRPRPGHPGRGHRARSARGPRHLPAAAA